MLRSDHDQALHRLYRFAAGGAEVAGLAALAQKARPREVVATSAIGAVGARAVGAPELTLDEVPRVGLPHHPIVNVDGSAIVKAREPVVGAHRDIHHPEIATLILLAGGLLEAGPEGIRPPRLEPTAQRDLLEIRAAREATIGREFAPAGPNVSDLWVWDPRGTPQPRRRLSSVRRATLAVRRVGPEALRLCPLPDQAPLTNRDGHDDPQPPSGSARGPPGVRTQRRDDPRG